MLSFYILRENCVDKPIDDLKIRGLEEENWFFLKTIKTEVSPNLCSAQVWKQGNSKQDCFRQMNKKNLTQQDRVGGDASSQLIAATN